MKEYTNKLVMAANDDALKEIGEYAIPIWAVGSLQYGDESGLSDDESHRLETWVNRFKSEGYTAITFDFTDDDSEFNIDPAFGLPCYTMNCTAWGYKR